MWNQFIEALIKLGVIAPEKKAEAEQMGEQFEKQQQPPAPAPAPAPVPTPPPAGGQPDFTALITEAVKAAVAPLNTKLEEEKTAREALQKQLADRDKSDLDTKIKQTLDAAVAAGKIPNDQAKIDAWKAKLEKDFDAHKSTLDDIPGNPALNKPGQKPTPPTPTPTKTDDPAANYQQLVQAAESAFSTTVSAN